MTIEAVDALRADHASLAALATEFTPSEWSAPSACEGWSVRDVVAHMTQIFRQVVDPTSLPPRDPSGSSERTQDRWVEAMRPLATQDVLDDYLNLGDQAIAVLAGLQGSDGPIDLGDLGTHPLHLVANALAFDHYTHIRADLLAPRGPLQHAVPSAGAGHLGAVMDWMVAGFPQMNADELAWLDVPLALHLTGPGGRSVAVGPDGSAQADVWSSTADFVLWATKREDWRQLDVRIAGDEATAERFCDKIRVF
jgi:uncharacterized protein (TIGR03083 family)